MGTLVEYPVQYFDGRGEQLPPDEELAVLLDDLALLQRITNGVCGKARALLLQDRRSARRAARENLPVPIQPCVGRQ